MGLFPFINSEKVLDSVKNDDLPLYREVAWDYEIDEPIIENGDFKIVEGKEAIKVWVYKALLTSRYVYSIYSWDYGSEIIELIGKRYTNALTKEECKRYIREALLINPYIKEVTITDIDLIDPKLTVNIKIDTIYGDEEVNVNV